MYLAPSDARIVLTPRSAPVEASPTEAPPSHKKKKGTKDHIPRPANAFILFRADFTKNHKLPDGIEKNNGSLSKIACAWPSLGFLAASDIRFSQRVEESVSRGSPLLG